MNAIFRLLAPLLLGSALLVFSAQAGDRPNIILCMADDMGWGDTGYNGHPYLKTPHLDQMSREGVMFTRFYSAAAMCSPTRASAYTGRNPYRFGVTFAMTGMLEPTEIPITTVLKQAGYTTGHFGKWHLGTLSKKQGDQARWGDFAKDPARYYCPPWERDVDVSFVTESKVPTWDPLVHPGAITAKEHGNPKVVAAKGSAYGNDYFTGPGVTETQNMAGDDSRVIMDRALPFIEDAVATDQPFFAVVWFHTPHSPVVGGDKYRAMYTDRSEDEQHYYATITALDEQVGRLRGRLDELGVAENTMLWFCSDNGPARQNSPRHVGSAGELSGYKLSLNEGGIRVPGLLVWPDRISAPQTVMAPAVTSDYFPTILDVLDIPLPADRKFDGVSLMPLLDNRERERTAPIGFLNRNATETAWIEERYKLLITKKGEALYDIIEDPAESQNLIESHPEVARRLQADSTKWREEVLAELALVP
ncbi:MAG: sulfatase-like hydrolase/transferase [Synoicihabitans sp.]